MRHEFDGRFDAWLDDAGRLGLVRHPSSEAVYRSIWNSFAEWCLSQTAPIQPLHVTPHDLRLFLRTRQGTADPSGRLSDRHAWTVLNLINRVMNHAAQSNGADGNAAAARVIASSPDIRYANASDSPTPDHLADVQARALIDHLTSERPASHTAVAPTQRWQDLRNRVAVALQLGAGLAPGDVRAMTLAGVVTEGGQSKNIPWKLRVPADGNTPARETPIASWAGRLAREWLDVRAANAIPGGWLFPSTRTGKPWSKMAQYRAAQQVLVDAGIDASDGGSFRLRHTFALRQLQSGNTPEDVARWMGIARLETLERYRRILPKPVEPA